jgi:hypothetical protein
MSPLLPALALIAATMSERPFPGAAMRVAADPVTGQIVAPEAVDPPLTIGEMQALAHREADVLVTIHNADGSDTLNHEGRFAEYAVVRLDASGKPSFRCLHAPFVTARPQRPAAVAAPATEDR